MQTQSDIVKRQDSVTDFTTQNLSQNNLHIPRLESPAVIPKQLDALTSLRFFACAAIIFLHSAWFFLDIEFMKNWQLDEGVTFFFVLSGFILTYVYSDLRGGHNIKQFLANRFGRMVPSHILLTFLTLAILPCSCATVGSFLANIFLVQSWIPRREYYFGLNAVSWSICAEIFFSVAFVMLIRPWKGGWIGKITLAFLITALACICAQLCMSSGNHSFFKFDEEYLLKINPLVRTFDFVLGMATAILWMRFQHLIKLSARTVTFIEIILIAIILFETTQITTLIEKFFPALKHYPAVIYCMTHGGCSPIFALAIFIMAMQKGYIAKALTNPILVWLGEISFSMYMIHFILIQCLSFYLPEFGRLCWPITYSVYLTAVILLSYLNFNLVENPARKLIKEIVSSPAKYYFSLSGLLNLFTPNWRSSAVTMALIITLAASAATYVALSQSRFHYSNLYINRSVDFENYFRLEKISVASAADGSKINLTWRSLKSQTVNRLLEISCIGKTGNMLEQYEKKDMFPLKLKSGESWSQTIYMPASANQRNKWDKLGLRLSMQVDDSKHHHQYRILSPHGGNTDWWATRLTIPLDKQVL